MYFEGQGDSIGSVEESLLLQIAHDSISNGFLTRKPLEVDEHSFPSALRRAKACFVTLTINGELRGCIGTTMPEQALIEAVSENAFAAAFRDPRFPPLKREEFSHLKITISILTVPKQMWFRDEEDLVSQLRPGVDGLIYQEAGLRGTFLPSVWEQIPDPKEFVRELKKKAGYKPDHWSGKIKIKRYETHSFSRNA